MVKRIRNTRAFSLIEMLVVVGVIVIISAIVLANNTKFGGVVLLENFAYDIALSIRQAQVYGISVVRFGTNNFTTPYGMHFDLANNQTYVLFADVNNNGKWDSNETVQTTSISRGFIISDMCVTPAGSGQICTNGSTLTKLDIIYKRPEPDAYISIDSSAQTYSSARINVRSPQGDVIGILVYQNGQITVHR